MLKLKNFFPFSLFILVALTAITIPTTAAMAYPREITKYSGATLEDYASGISEERFNLLSNMAKFASSNLGNSQPIAECSKWVVTNVLYDEKGSPISIIGKAYYSFVVLTKEDLTAKLVNSTLDFQIQDTEPLPGADGAKIIFISAKGYPQNYRGECVAIFVYSPKTDSLTPILCQSVACESLDETMVTGFDLDGNDFATMKDLARDTIPWPKKKN